MNGNERRRSIVHEFKFDQHLSDYFHGDIQRADWEIRNWGERVAKWPDMGHAVHGALDYLGIPFHSSVGAFLVVYWYDDDYVYCLGMQPIPWATDDPYDKN